MIQIYPQNIVITKRRIHIGITQLPNEDISTKTQRGRPQIYIALLADGRPRITGLEF